MTALSREDEKVTIGTLDAGVDVTASAEEEAWIGAELEVEGRAALELAGGTGPELTSVLAAPISLLLVDVGADEGVRSTVD